MEDKKIETDIENIMKIADLLKAKTGGLDGLTMFERLQIAVQLYSSYSLDDISNGLFEISSKQ